MIPKTVASRAYRWAAPTVATLIRRNPASAVHFFEADPTTKHYVALAVRGWETYQKGSAERLDELAADLFCAPRSTVLAALWNQRFGKLTVLRRLPGRVLRRHQYDRLVTVMTDPDKRRLLHRSPRIAAAELEVIACLDDPMAAAAALAHVGQLQPGEFEYALAGVRHYRPDLVGPVLGEALRQLGHAKNIPRWLQMILRDASLPLPPCDGMASLVPLRTVGEIRAAGTAFRNCLREDHVFVSVLLGHRYYYVTRAPADPAVASIVFDQLIATWRLERCEGPGNSRLKPAAERRIRDAFAAHGIGYFGEWPRSRVLGSSDPFMIAW